jgi:two-component system response regulator HydG
MDSKPQVLVVEDDPAGGRLMRALFQPVGCEVLLAARGDEALALADKNPYIDVIFLDLGLPDMDGMAVLEALKKTRPQVPVVILTGDTELPTAVKAIQLGALNYFTKPINTDQILAVLRQTLERRQLLSQLEDLKGQLNEGNSLARQMGPGPAIARLQEQVKQVAATQFTVLVHGETGAGKEVVARSIHDQSPRAAQAFIALDCGAIPEALLESELFGYEKGAFSGAERKKEGHFVLAQGGTLFLDEIANLPLGLQAKLLRVLQERELQPLGSTKKVSLDVRFIAASNHDLEKEAAAGRFRQDLFFRLAEFRIGLPALRDRLEDLPYLAQRFLEEASVELRRPVRSIDPGALALLKEHPWTGNVRELRNVIRQALLLSRSSSVEEGDVAGLLKRAPARPQPSAPALDAGMTLKQIGEAGLAAAEQDALRQALRASQGNILQAARALKADNKTLHTKLKKYKIRARDFEPQGGSE